jgi:hypothetical protein
VAVAVAAAQGEAREFYCGAGKLQSARAPEPESHARAQCWSEIMGGRIGGPSFRR